MERLHFLSIAAAQHILKYSHFTDESILIHRPAFLPSAVPRCLRPHFLHILQHHITVPVKSFDTGQQLAVVAAGDEYLGVGSDGRLEDGERAGGEFVLFEDGDLIFSAGGDGLVHTPRKAGRKQWKGWYLQCVCDRRRMERVKVERT